MIWFWIDAFLVLCTIIFIGACGAGGNYDHETGEK